MADLGANGFGVTQDIPIKKAFLIDQDGILFVSAGTIIPTVKRWNPDTEMWDIIPPS